MPCYCPVAGKEENDWAIKSHPKVQKEAADCFFLFWKLPFASETAIFGDVIYIFFCRQRICRLRHRENVRLIFINFVWVFFLSCRRNGIVEQCEHGGRRRPQDRETPPSASSPSFFLSSFFSILPLGGRRLLNALTTQRPTALCSSSASSHLRFFFTTTTASSTCVQCFKRIKDGG